MLPDPFHAELYDDIPETDFTVKDRIRGTTRSWLSRAEIQHHRGAQLLGEMLDRVA